MVARALLVDTNLLLVLLVGSVDRAHVARFTRTRQYDEQDFDYLLALIAGYQERVVTPHILTELSNLAGHLEGSYRDEARLALRRLTLGAREHCDPSVDVVSSDLFSRLGLGFAPRSFSST